MENKYTLTKEDTEVLRCIGYGPEDIKKVNYISRKNDLYFVLSYLSGGGAGCKEGITREQALAVLGHEKFMRGLGQCSYKQTTTEMAADGYRQVVFVSPSHFNLGYDPLIPFSNYPWWEKMQARLKKEVG